MRTSVFSSIFFAGLVFSNIILGDVYGGICDDGYNRGYEEGTATCPQILCSACPGLFDYQDGQKEGLTACYEDVKKSTGARLGNDLSLTLPILLNANGETMVNNPTQLKYHQKGIVAGTTSQGFHAFTVDSLGGNPLPNPSAKATLRLLVVGGTFPSTITPVITSENNAPNAPSQIFICNANSNSCEMVLNFGNGKEKVSIPTPQNATWQGSCTNTDLGKSCNVEMNKPYQTIALIY